MNDGLSRCGLVLAGAMLIACTGAVPPPPVLTVTSPQRGLVQDGGPVMVRGTTQPGADGYAVNKVVINGTVAQLASDGSFSALVPVEPGASMLATTATTENGGAATDTRSVHVGELRAVGSTIERAVTATLSADAFGKLSDAAGAYIMGLDIPAMIAPLQPMVDADSTFADVKASVTNLGLGNVTITLTPVDGALMFSAEVDMIDIGAKADYHVIGIGGSQTVSMTADQVVLSGQVAVTPTAGNDFTVAINSPTITTQNMKLHTSSGLANDIIDMLQDNLAGTIKKVATKGIEKGLAPIISNALKSATAARTISVMQKTVTIQAAPQALEFTTEGALVTVNLSTALAGSEVSPGYIYVPSGEPTLEVGDGIQLALSDNLLNGVLAQVHALGLLDMHFDKDYGVFNAIDIHLASPPMVSANTEDGSLRLMIGDAIGTLSNNGNPVISAAVNAEVDVTVTAGESPDQVALQFGNSHLALNFLDDQAADDPNMGGDPVGLAIDVRSIAGAGIELKLADVGQFMVTLPTPEVLGVTLDHFGMRTDSGYAIVSAQIH